VRTWTDKRGVDVVVEHIGGETFEKSVYALTRLGTLVTIGSHDTHWGRLDLRHVYSKNLRVVGTNLGSILELRTILDYVTANRLEHVVAYWALQKLGGVPTPVNFRFAPAELGYVLEDSGAKVALFEEATAPAVTEAARGRSARLVYLGADAPAGAIAFDELVGGGGAIGATRVPLEDRTAPDAVVESDLSLLLYTSGTTGRPKGVPRTHKNHYAGAVAHVIQCGYTRSERTLGVMPLYHTMGIHSLTSMAAVNGCFVCQPDWSAAGALRLIAEERLTALYLIPTLYWDLVHAPGLAQADVASVRKLAYAGAPMLAPLAEACAKAFRPEVF